MKIGIIGAGGIGRLYASLWHAAGHDVFLSARSSERHRTFVTDLGENAHLGTPAEAATFGDIVLLAVNYASVGEAIDAIRPHTTGKLLIDATNPLVQKDDGSLERMIADDDLAAEVMAAHLPDARIAKAFTTLWTGHVEERGDVADPKIAMPYATNEPDDRAFLETLIADAGLVPVHLGGLAASRPLDPGSTIWNIVLTKDELLTRIAASQTPQTA